MNAETLIALAERAEQRGQDMQTDAELLQIELAALEAQKDARWAAFEADKSDHTRRQWIAFHDRLTTCRANLRQTQEDGGHYLDCAAALRSRATMIEEEKDG